MSHSTGAHAWAVFCKELLDALRDRRTLVMVLLSSVAMGPVVLVLISTLASSFEKRAEAREVVVVAQGRTVAQGTVDELSARTGLADFEETFVALAFGGVARPGPGVPA